MRRSFMRTYTLTVFEKDGTTTLDETFEASNDEEAKEIGIAKLREKDLEHKTHRCVSQDANLILFQR